MPAATMAAAVPLVAISVKPMANRPLATPVARGLSLCLTEMKAFPERGSRVPAPICDFTKASPKLLPTPITSPVDFISGPSMVSTPGNLTKGNTASLTLKYGGVTSSKIPCASSDWPTMHRAATLANWMPVALLTKGTVREARGLTSRTKISARSTPCASRCCCMANCTFISPTTLSACAIAVVWRLSSVTVAADSEYGGSEQAESPLCTPACSICSISPPTNTRWPSQMASTSHSMASLRKRSSSTGESCDTLTASRM